MSKRGASLQVLGVVAAAVLIVLAGTAWWAIVAGILDVSRAAKVLEADASAPGWPRYVEVLTDPVTGCQYIGRAGKSAWTPRLGTDGKQVCGEVTAR